VPPNGLPHMQRCYDSYVIVGAGKTAMDAILWLLDHSVQPSRISWIMPRDSWLLMREGITPNGMVNLGPEGLMAAQTAGSVEELFLEWEKSGLVGRIDQSVIPTMNHCATVDAGELEKLRRVTSVVRMGHVLRVEPGQVTLQEGSLSVPGAALYVDCSSNGLRPRPPVKVFDGSKITLQSVLLCQQVFSAALIAHIEIRRIDDDAKNALCTPVPHPETSQDFLRGQMVGLQNMLSWERAGVGPWLRKARLNQQAHTPDFKVGMRFVWRVLRSDYGGALLRRGQTGVQEKYCKFLERLLDQQSSPEAPHPEVPGVSASCRPVETARRSPIAWRSVRGG